MTRRKSVYVQYRSNHHHRRPNYMVDISSNVTFLKNVFDPWLVESMDVEPRDTKR